MGVTQTIWADPVDYLRAIAPQRPGPVPVAGGVAGAGGALPAGFPGFVTYAVKANPEEAVIVNLAAAGIAGFDVASPDEIRLIRRLVPGAALHYNNPVRARHEIAVGVAEDVHSYSVDSLSELDKLFEQVPLVNGRGEAVEITARFKLPVAGAVYDFGAKFGATEDLATEILARIAAAATCPR
jgi:ornithine decarboxylase